MKNKGLKLLIGLVLLAVLFANYETDIKSYFFTSTSSIHIYEETLDNNINNKSIHSGGVAAWITHGNKKLWKVINPNKIMSNTVKLNAARNEWEPFQVLVEAQETLNNLTITATDLNDESGNIIVSPIIYRQHYVNITDTANATYGHTGYVPDALIPIIHPVTGSATSGLYGGNTFNLKAGDREAFWFDIYINKDVLPGIYHGTVTVKAEGLPHKEVTVQLEVFDVTLPSKKNLLACFQMDLESISKLHSIKDNNSAEAFNLGNKYEQMLHEHYINNWSPVLGWDYSLNGLEVSIVDGKVVVDWSEYDKLVEPYMNGSVFTDKVPSQCLFAPYWLPIKNTNGEITTDHITLKNYENIDIDLFKQYLTELARHFHDKGWLQRTFFFYFDEPFLNEWKYDAFMKVSNIVKQEVPDLKIMITDGYRNTYSLTNKDFNKNIDVWDPITFQIYDIETLKFYKQRKEQGDLNMWCQTLANSNSNPNKGMINLFPEYDMPFHRMWGILSWSFGFQAIEWWQTVYFNKKVKNYDPWVSAKTISGFKQPINGDGRLFYPGTKNSVGIEVPISSLRMKSVREAIEDYEYLYILDKKSSLSAVDISNVVTFDEIKSRNMKHPTAMGKKTWYWWESDPDAIMEFKAQMLQTIVSSK